VCYFQNRLFKLLILLLLLILKIYPIKGFATIYLCFLELKKNPNFLYLEVLNQVMDVRKSRFPSLFLFFFSTPQNFFLFIRRNSTPWKAYFVGLGERVKPRLSQVLTRGARPDSNSRPAVQISSPLPFFFSTPQNSNSQFVS
jgi:hypothetical protein